MEDISPHLTRLNQIQSTAFYSLSEKVNTVSVQKYLYISYKLRSLINYLMNINKICHFSRLALLQTVLLILN